MSHIVIVGGGAGGLVLATRLGHQLGRKGLARITLIDRSMTHVWKPLLHEVAAGTIDSHKDDVIYLGHAKGHGFHFQPGTLIGLDRAAKRITLAAVTDPMDGEIVPTRELAYDILVLAVGCVSNDYRVPGAREHCAFLETVEQAERVRLRWLNSCLRQQAMGGEPEAGELHMAIVGGGATGVELAAEMCKASRRLVTYNFDQIDLVRDFKVTLIDSNPRVLPGLPQRLGVITERELAKLGVEVINNDRVSAVTADAIETTGGRRIFAKHKIWAAGVKAPDFLRDLGGLPTNAVGQVVVDQTLRVDGDESIFALGDCAECPRPGHARPVPPRAQAAYQQALLLSRSLVGRLKGRPLLPFVYNDHGSLVSISDSGIGALMGNLLGDVMLEGALARWAYLSLYKKHQQALHGLTWVVFNSLINLLRRRTEPRMKLH